MKSPGTDFLQNGIDTFNTSPIVPFTDTSQHPENTYSDNNLDSNNKDILQNGLVCTTIDSKVDLPVLVQNGEECNNNMPSNLIPETINGTEKKLDNKNDELVTNGVKNYDEDEFDIIDEVLNNEHNHLVNEEIVENHRIVTRENCLNDIELAPKLQKLNQKFSSPIITEAMLKQSVKPLKAVKENQLNEVKNKSKRINKDDVRSVIRTRHSSSIETIESLSDEKFKDTTMSEKSDACKEAMTSEQVKLNSKTNTETSVATCLKDLSETNKIKEENMRTELKSEIEDNVFKESENLSKKSKREIFKQASMKRKSVDYTETPGETACSEPNAKQVKKLQLLPEQKKITGKTGRRLSRDYSIDKVRKYNQRIKQYNNRIDKENQENGVSTSGSENVSTLAVTSSKNRTSVSAPFERVSETELRESVDFNLNVSINQAIQSDIDSNVNVLPVTTRVNQMTADITENPANKEINLDVDIELTLENSKPAISQVEASSHKGRALGKQRSDEASLINVEELHKQQELEETSMVNEMINDIAKRRAQRMVRSKASISTPSPLIDVKHAATSPRVTPQHSMDSTSSGETTKSNLSFAKRLKKKVSNRFTRSFDKSIDKTNIETGNKNSSSLVGESNQTLASATSSTSDLQVPTSRAQYDSGIEQTPCDLEISEDALEYNKDESTPGLYVYSDKYPDVKLRDKKSSRKIAGRFSHRKSREVSFAETEIHRQESCDVGDREKRKSGSHLHRYKRSSSKVKIARERSIDRDKYHHDHHRSSLSREQSLDGGNLSRRGSLRKQKSYRDSDEIGTDHYGKSRDKSLSRDDSKRNSLRRKSLDRHKSIDRQKSIDRGEPPKPKFKSHKNKFLEDLDLAKKKALIQMLRDNKLNLTKELSRKSIDLNEYERVKKSLSKVIKGPARQDSKDEFNTVNILNKFNKEIEKNHNHNQQKIALSKKQSHKDTPSQSKTEKLKPVKENFVDNKEAVKDHLTANKKNAEKSSKIDSKNKLNQTNTYNNNKTAAEKKQSPLKEPTSSNEKVSTKNKIPVKQEEPEPQKPKGAPKIVFDLDNEEENNYFEKRKQRRLRKKEDGDEDDDEGDAVTKEKVSIAQQIDLYNLQKAKEKKSETADLPGSKGNKNLEYKANEDPDLKKAVPAPAKANKPIESKAKPKEEKKTTTLKKVSPVKKDSSRSKSTEPLGSTKDRAALFGPRKVFKQVKPIDDVVDGAGGHPVEDESKKKGGNSFNAIANLRSSLRRVTRKPSVEEAPEKVLPSGTFLLPDPEQRKTSKSGGLAALLERDANSKDTLKFEDKPKKPGHEQKEDVRGISASSLQQGKNEI